MRKFIFILLFQFSVSYLFAQGYYDIISVGFAANGSILGASAINDTGQVAGYYAYDEVFTTTAFIWENGNYFDILNPDIGFDIRAYDINNKGEITGIIKRDSIFPENVSFIYSNGVITYIEPLDGHWVDAYGINDMGWVTGWTHYNDEIYNRESGPFIYINGVITRIGSGRGGSGNKINNQGWIVGYSPEDDYRTYFPYMSKNNIFEPLSRPPDVIIGKAKDLNENGEVCGYFTLSNNRDQAVKWDESGDVISLAELPNQIYSQAICIDNSGNVGGKIGIDNQGSVAVVWNDNTVIIIDSLINPSLGIKLYDVRDISDNGRWALLYGAMNGIKQYFVINLPDINDLIVNSIGDESDANLNDGICDVDLNTEGNQCTMRAAIEQTNFYKWGGKITFDISGGGVPTIMPESPLPEINTPIKIDGTTQPGSGLVEIKGTSAGTDVNGLSIITASDISIKGLVINEFDGYGIYLEGVENDTISSCLIGTDPTGMEAKPNVLGGILLNNSINNVIGGDDLSDRNVISGNGVEGHTRGHGILIEGERSTGNKIEGNIIGANITGTEALPNKTGIGISSSSGNQIGGVTDKPGNPPGNLISGNTVSGVFIGGDNNPASSNEIMGNLIGTNIGGTDSLLGQYIGVWLINDADSNVVGGTTQSERNVISGNTGAGIYIMSKKASANVIKNNFIGVGASGKSMIGNGRQGIFISDSPENIIGDNVITGNYGAQIVISEKNSTGNKVSGNMIGLYSDSLSVPEDPPDAVGIYIALSSKNKIGGEGNVISGNKLGGILLQQTNDNVISGNLIGTDVTGADSIGNGDKWGIALFGSSSNIIGGLTAKERNIISGNEIGVALQVLFDGPIPDKISSSNKMDKSDIIKESVKYALKLYRSQQEIGEVIKSHIPIIKPMEGLDTQYEERSFIQLNGKNIQNKKNKIIGNYIGTTKDGMESLGNKFGVFVTTGSNNNYIGGNSPGEGNVISGNERGVALYYDVTGCRIEGNVIGTAADRYMPLPNKIAGVVLLDVSRNYVGGMKHGAGNLISKNTEGNLLLLETFQNRIYKNKIMYGTVGIDVIYADKDEVISNKIWYNDTGIKGGTSTLIIKGNSIKDNVGTSTGIYADNCTGIIEGNIIEGNSGDGIRYVNGSTPVVRENNILGNEGFGVNNTTSSIVVDAAENWWGDASGPSGIGTGSGDGVSANVNYQNWKSEVVSLVILGGQDTTYQTSGTTDTVMISVLNWSNPTDVVDITLKDSKGWLTGKTSFTVAIDDSVGSAFPVVINIPSGTAPNVTTKVNVQGVSQKNASHTDEKDFYVTTYTSELQRIIILPDSVVLTVGDSLQFTVLGYDQLYQPVDFYPEWSTDLGSIDNTGLYYTPNTSGVANVTVTDPVTGLIEKAIVVVKKDPTEVKENKRVIPKEYLLSQNYPNPFNPSTKIEFALPKRSSVTLEVYNMLGERIETLVKGVLNAGYHEVSLDGRSLSSGIYIYRIIAYSTNKADRFVSVKKMILLK